MNRIFGTVAVLLVLYRGQMIIRTQLMEVRNVSNDKELPTGPENTPEVNLNPDVKGDINTDESNDVAEQIKITKDHGPSESGSKVTETPKDEGLVGKPLTLDLDNLKSQSKVVIQQNEGAKDNEASKNDSKVSEVKKATDSSGDIGKDNFRDESVNARDESEAISGPAESKDAEIPETEGLVEDTLIPDAGDKSVDVRNLSEVPKDTEPADSLEKDTGVPETEELNEDTLSSHVANESVDVRDKSEVIKDNEPADREMPEIDELVENAPMPNLDSLRDEVTKDVKPSEDRSPTSGQLKEDIPDWNKLNDDFDGMLSESKAINDKISTLQMYYQMPNQIPIGSHISQETLLAFKLHQTHSYSNGRKTKPVTSATILEDDSLFYVKKLFWDMTTLIPVLSLLYYSVDILDFFVHMSIKKAALKRRRSMMSHEVLSRGNAF